jgi:thiol-disulfide isomerase/thioredoxin
MKQNLFLYVAISFATISCSSSDHSSKEHDKKVDTISKNIQIPADKTSKYPIIDTTLIFTNAKELNTYKKKFDQEFKALHDSANIQNSFVLDSLKKTNEDLYTVLAYKLTINTKQNIHLLLYNLDFSNLVSLQDRLQAFNSMPEQIKNSKEGKFILDRLVHKEEQSQQNIGIKLSKPSSFQLLDSNRQNHFLTDLLSTDRKYTLLIFSASWCSPCRYEGLWLKKLFAKIDHSQLSIITVSVDKDIQKWKKAIKTDNCPWMQVWTSGEFNSDLTKALNIKVIPTNLLLNNQQEIVAQNTNVTEIFSKFPNLYIK